MMFSFIHPLLPYLLNSTSFIIILISVILIHEGGHCIASKRCGCKVKIFSIGFGKPFFKKEFRGTIYQISWFMLGGYCSLEGEDGKSKSKTGLFNLTYIQKLYIVLGGVGANCLSAILAFGLYSMFNITIFSYFGYLSILIGLINLVPIPGIDGSFPLLFLLEKIFGKKEGIKVIQRAMDIGIFFVKILNIGCIGYFVYKIMILILI